MGTKKTKTGQIVDGQLYRIKAVDDWGVITYNLLAVHPVNNLELERGSFSMPGEKFNKRKLTVAWPDGTVSAGHTIRCETLVNDVQDMGNSYRVTNYVPVIDVKHRGMTLVVPLDGLMIRFLPAEKKPAKKTKTTKRVARPKPIGNMP